MRWTSTLTFLIGSALSLGVFPQTSGASLRENWISIQVQNEIVTAQEVRDYIDAVVLSSDVHRTLFQEAHGDYSVYESRRNELIDELFPSTLDRMALARILQAEAIKTQGRTFFGMTRDEMKRVVKQQVGTALAKFQKKGLPSSEAEAALAEEIKNSGMPYDSKRTPSETYQLWEKRLRSRLREDYRQREISRFVCSIGNCGTSSPVQIIKRKLPFIESRAFLVIRPTPVLELKQADAFARLRTIEDSSIRRTSETSPEANETKSFFYLGRITNDRVELLHLNDWNLTGSIGEKLGYPKTDDMGRTSGFVLTIKRSGELGNLTVQAENWLFAERLPSAGKTQRQNVEEENTVRIASRHFLDEEGNKWVLVGISGTERAQKAGLGSWIQNEFHGLTRHSSVRIDEPRNGTEVFVQGLFGIGGKYSIIDQPHVDLVLTGEGVLGPAMGDASQSDIKVSSALDLGFYGSSKDLPVLRIGAFSEFRVRANGEIETMVGGKITTGMVIKKIQLEAGLYVVRWDGEMDRRYEGGASWNTGIMISATRAPDRNTVPYEL